MSEITHISGPCTSCDWEPVKTCERYKDGIWPLCCPNLEEKHKKKLRGNEE